MSAHVDSPLQTRGEAALRTTCGREMRVGYLALGSAQRPSRQVSLAIGHAPGDADITWAALTPAEMRQLAAALLREAAAAEHPGDGATARQIDVNYAGGEAYAVTARGHMLLTDQPLTAGGADTAVTPIELLIAALASCVAFYTGRYLARHRLNRDGLHVTTTFTTADHPARVDTARLRISIPGGIPADREKALLAVASHCTVHNTFRQPPEITIELNKADQHAARKS